MNDEFYIGYEPAMPRRMAARIRAASAVLLGVAVLLSMMLVLAQGRFAASTFEFGHTRTFEGIVVEYPYPSLLVRTSDERYDTYWLVGAGKHDASDIVRSEEHTSELQSLRHLVCRLLLE